MPRDDFSGAFPQPKSRACASTLAVFFCCWCCLLPAAHHASGPRQVDLSRARGAQTEASIAIDPHDSKILLAASQNGLACAVRVYSSANGGRTCHSKALATPGGQLTRKDPAWRGHLCAGNEWVGIGSTGAQYIAFVAGNIVLAHRGWTLFVTARRAAGAAWSKPVQVDHSSAGRDDKPMLLVDTSSSSVHQGRVYVGWTRSVDNTRTVVVAHSDDRGRTWSSPVRIGEGWGVHLALARDGTLYAGWWGSDGILEVSDSSDGGDRLGRPRPFLSLLRYTGFGSGLIPAMRREAVHPNPSLDVDRSGGRYQGRLYAAASVPSPRGRVTTVTVLDRHFRKLLVRRLGSAHGRKVRDAFNPALAVDQANGTVWLCFYLTGAGRSRILATYSCSKSRDGGSHWSTIRAVASVPSNEAQPGGFRTPSGVHNEYASYEGLAASRGIAYPVWTDTRHLKRLREEVYGTRVTR